MKLRIFFICISIFYGCQKHFDISEVYVLIMRVVLILLLTVCGTILLIRYLIEENYLQSKKILLSKFTHLVGKYKFIEEMIQNRLHIFLFQ